MEWDIIVSVLTLILFVVILIGIYFWSINDTMKKDAAPLTEDEERKWRDFLRKEWWE